MRRVTKELNGKCLCGAVNFKASGAVKRVSACYCGQCQTQNGGGAFYGVELQGQLVIEDAGSLVWYESSTIAKRGFCSLCGSSLFWVSNTDPSYFDVSLGVLDNYSGLTLSAHIFIENCPAYMTIPDTAPHLTEADVQSKPLRDH